MLEYLIIFMVLLLAWVNGANDIAKGIATLVGNGTASARQALWWGTAWTVIGGLFALLWGGALLKVFSSGYLGSENLVTYPFILGAIVGAAGWVGVATWLALPVSTTHALLGGVVGAALVLAGPDGLRLGAVVDKALLPLLVAPLLAIGLCALLLMLARYVATKVPAWRPGCCPQQDWQKNPFVCADPETPLPSVPMRRLWTGLHWASSGVTCFARGLNDVPKIAAFLVLLGSLAPGVAGISLSQESILWPILLVTVVMGLGSLLGGRRVLQLLSWRVTSLDASRGLVANVGTSMLVLFAAPLGLPVSTTHVSTGALMGVRWADRVPPQGADAVRLVLFGWLVTLPVAAGIAALVAGLSAGRF